MARLSEATLFNQNPSDNPNDDHPAVIYARSRKDDPETSREAAAAHENSGKAQSHREMILEALHEADGLTAGEIANQCGNVFTHVEACRRLPELQKQGRVEPGKKRKCGAQHTEMRVWSLTKEGAA